MCRSGVIIKVGFSISLPNVAVETQLGLRGPLKVAWRELRPSIFSTGVTLSRSFWKSRNEVSKCPVSFRFVLAKKAIFVSVFCSVFVSVFSGGNFFSQLFLCPFLFRNAHYRK